MAPSAGEVGTGEVWADEGVESPAAWARSRSDRCVPQAVVTTTAHSSAAEARHVCPRNPWYFIASSPPHGAFAICAVSSLCIL